MTGSIVRLKDAEGNIINIPAFKGKDGISPLLRKSDTAIEVSYDGGATYTELAPKRNFMCIAARHGTR